MKQLAKCLTAIICIVNVSLLQLYADTNENGEQSFFFNFNTEDSNTSAEENSETVPEETTDKKAEKPLKTFSPQELSEAATRLESLSNQIKSVIAKANSIPDIENMVKRRIEKKKISLGTIVSWEDLQREIQLLQTLLYKLYALDPFTKNYRYLNYLLNDEALYEKLKELDKALISYDKEFVVDTYFGLVQLSDASKEALEQLLTTLGTAISENQLILNLANVIKQFDPEAKKIAEQEKKAIQQAIAKKRTAHICSFRVCW